MIRFIALRTLQALPVLLAVIVLTFILVRMAPGGPFDNEKVLPTEVIEQLNARYHLDQPLPVQLFDYLSNLLRGDFGPSFRYPGRSVGEMIASGLPFTLELAFYALAVAVSIGILTGMVAATRPGTTRDYLPMSLAMTGICIPSFLMGPLLVLVFAVWLEWLPVSGWGYSPGDKVLPAITLGTTYAAFIARLTRGGMLEVLQQDYIRTARAKGASEFKVLFHHALRGGLAPAVAYLGPATAGLISGSFVVETIFQIPGLGRFYVEAAFNRDYTMILGTTIFYAALILAFNLLSDVLTAALNPRIRASINRVQ